MGSFVSVFRPVLKRVMERYAPEAIVLQCGADSLAGDRLGCFNLTLQGHAHCVEYTRSFGVPLLVLGGGGYTMRNVARCWTYETGVLLGTTLKDEMPYNDYFEYYGPDYRLHINASNMENRNTRERMDRITNELLQTLDDLPPVPSIAVQTGSSLATPATIDYELEAKKEATDLADPDSRPPEDDGRPEHQSELMPSVSGPASSTMAVGLKSTGGVMAPDIGVSG